MKDFPRAKEGRERIFPLLSPFSPCEGRGEGCTHRNVIMIIVLSILLFFCQFFTFFGLQASTSPKSKCAGRKNHTQGLATGL